MNDKSVVFKHKLELCFIAILCLVAIGVNVLCLFVPQIRPPSESPASWFQRSGAITSIFCVFAQYRMSNFFKAIQGSSFGESWWLYKIFKNHNDFLSWVVTIFTIWGALVWGYGDLLVKCLMPE
jgi:hypothetical protein